MGLFCTNRCAKSTIYKKQFLKLHETRGSTNKSHVGEHSLTFAHLCVLGI